MKRLCLLAVLLAAAAPAQAQFSVVPYVGYDVRVGDPLVGVGIEFATLPEVFSFGIAIRPSAEYYYTPEETRGGLTLDRQRFQANLDVLADVIPPDSRFGLHVGLGLGYHHSSVNQYGLTLTDSDLGLNLLAGADMEVRAVRPYVQARVRRDAGASLLTMLGGVRVRI